MKSPVDEYFDIKTDKIPTSFESTITDFSADPLKESACVVIKSDEVRIIARKKDADKPKGSPEINGSIRIIKEGDKKGDAACILILPDGTIQISGSKIILGRVEADDGKKETTAGGDGPGQSEPYMRYSDFSIWAGKLMEALEKEFNSAYDIMANDIAGTAIGGMAGGIGATVTPGWGNPDPGNVAGAAAGNAGVGVIQGKVAPAKGLLSANFTQCFGEKGTMTVKIKSTRVFGE
jgi:hypothetical protein